MIGLLMQAQWVTEASDFITQNWDKLLGVLGGTSGIIAIVTFIAKLILTCVQGRIARKNGTPLQVAFESLRQDVTTAVCEFQTSLQNLLAQQTNEMKEELKAYLQELIEKANKIKMALYDSLVSESGNTQELIDELDTKIVEAQTVIESAQNKAVLELSDDVVQEVEECTAEVQNEVSASPEQAAKPRNGKKSKHIIVER